MDLLTSQACPLCSTESSFRIHEDVESKAGLARGLIQITESARQFLGDEKGELKDHLIQISIEESRDPEINLAAGIRWLHHKKKLARHRLKREASWEEAVAEYKGILSQLGENKKADKIMEKLLSFHSRLKQHRK